MNSTLSDFFAMGGYAFYVWTSYGLALIILIINWLLPLNRQRTLLKTLVRKARRKQRDNPDSHP